MTSDRLSASRVIWLVTCLIWPAIAYGSGFLVLLDLHRMEDLGRLVIVPILAIAGALAAILCFITSRKHLPPWLPAIAVVENVAFAIWILSAYFL